MKYYDLLLSDEQFITEEDYNERKFLVNEFSLLPTDFFSKLRHFQPQVGCLNSCKICSKHANSKTEYWSISRVRNVIAALKELGKEKHKYKPYIVWDREEHRSGVIFSYLDNDIGNYIYLKEFIELAYTELGVRTRISTVGYSRHDNQICDMHRNINSSCLDYLGGVRLSFTPYTLGWCSSNSKFSKNEYINDMINFLKTYQPYYEKYGSGSRKMCVEIRYKPLVELKSVHEFKFQGYYVISTGNYLYISKDAEVEFKESIIADPYDHHIKLSQDPIYFYEINLYHTPDSIDEIQKIVYDIMLKWERKMLHPKKVEVYMLSNYDGKYYSINPKITEDGNYGINIYPKTEGRNNSGYIITERFLLNAMFKYKREKGLNSMDPFYNSTWEDVYKVLDICKSIANNYKNNGKNEKAKYISKEVIPMIEAYVFALQEAGYSATNFFNPEFSIDTGIICNMGRAIKEFKGITYKENEPLTPTHERNYGRHSSTMTKENVAWRLSCDYNNSIVIEQLNLAATSEVGGQVSFKKKLNLSKGDYIFTINDLYSKYLIPGQRRN
ncbi:MAG: hypothetical protein IJ094_09150 [Bacilli bacterium]|nr:hypothetical protein [Bacilli bacterium]